MPTSSIPWSSFIPWPIQLMNLYGWEYIINFFFNKFLVHCLVHDRKRNMCNFFICKTCSIFCNLNPGNTGMDWSSVLCNCVSSVNKHRDSWHRTCAAWVDAHASAGRSPVPQSVLNVYANELEAALMRHVYWGSVTVDIEFIYRAYRRYSWYIRPPLYSKICLSHSLNSWIQSVVYLLCLLSSNSKWSSNQADQQYSGSHSTTWPDSTNNSPWISIKTMPSTCFLKVYIFINNIVTCI